MTALQQLREAIDEDKENMPEGLYLSLMEHLVRAYNEHAPSSHTYYTVSWVSVSCRQYRVQWRQYSTLCKLVPHGPRNSPEGWMDALRMSILTSEMVQTATFPMTIPDERGGVMIVCDAACEDDSDSDL